jgi:succinate dehydrogenase/fumarate reductase flavoprotein subunit
MLLNSRGDAFLAWEDPRVAKLALTTEWNKLLFSKASMREVLAGRGSPNGGVYFSLKHMPVEVFDSLEEILPNWRFQGDDFSQLFVALREGHAAEVGPAAEYFEGGVRVDERCRTSLEGLYAAGECTGGLFGANRVAAATTEMLVFGEVAGREAARFADQVGWEEPSREDVERLAESITTPLRRNGGESPALLWREIRDIAYQKIGVIRERDQLRRAAEGLEELRERIYGCSTSSPRRSKNREWIRALELRNLVDCLLASATAAEARGESRGVHMRRDRPAVDHENWRLHLVVRSGDEGPLLAKEPVKSDKSPPASMMSYEEAIVWAAETLLAREEGR